ncbi:MAG: hypothetical protein K2Y22_14140 [Candidatus Obscuribacterales bacterium]|nr:hypothetical protein [Candidatus Obscuribacterales bacterium]
MQENARKLWELSIRIGYAADLQVKLLAGRDKTKNWSEIIHAAQCVLLGQQLNMLLRLLGGLEQFSPRAPISDRAKLSDTTERQALMNVKREFKELKRKKTEVVASPLGLYLYEKSFSTLDEAIAMFHAALNKETLISAKLLQGNHQKAEPSVTGLQEKYHALCATVDNLYLMSFVDHLLISAKAIVEPPLALSPGENAKPLSKWAEMEGVKDVTERVYTCGDVDVTSVWTAVSKEVAEQTRPIESTLYALSLIEVAAEIGNKLAQ